MRPSAGPASATVHICLVYDCLYPYTVGGVERWYRRLAERVAADGHEVTYLTLRQWEDGERADLAGVSVVPVGPQLELYTAGRRRIWPAIRFGLGVLRHLRRHGARYDVVHCASTPFFALLAAGIARRGRHRLIVDWVEVWTRAYWREYLGTARGLVAWTIQRLSTRVGERAFCYSRLHERRLRAEGFRRPIDVIGVYTGPTGRPEPSEASSPLVVFAGRHIPEKGVLALPAALALARSQASELRGRILGDGPLRAEVERLVREEGQEAAVSLPGFVPEAQVREELSQALCLILPSTREGYGLVVVEASSVGTPAIVVDAPDNAALELVEDGVNGVVAPSAAPEDLADAILRVREAGAALRESTADWFERNGERFSVERSIRRVLEVYEG